MQEVPSSRVYRSSSISQQDAESSQLHEESEAWRGELAQRLEAYRSRRRKSSPNIAQTQLPFEERAVASSARTAVAVDEPTVAEDDFSFTIAIGRPPKKRENDDPRMVIDVSLPSNTGQQSLEETTPEAVEQEPQGLYPTASIEERRLAGVIDAACLLFVFGGFLTLFGALGMQFTLSKLSATVYTATFAIVYLQYFALFTIFGGTTPGMMMRNLQVASFSGEQPSPRQMLLRSAGYMLSAGTFFLGFLWSMWDADSLTWHDRLSRTYLTSSQTLADLDVTTAAHSR